MQVSLENVFNNELDGSLSTDSELRSTGTKCTMHLNGQMTISFRNLEKVNAFHIQCSTKSISKSV